MGEKRETQEMERLNSKDINKIETIKYNFSIVEFYFCDCYVIIMKIIDVTN